VIQKLFAGVAALILAGLGFYGGRAYQNSIDQKLITDYNPPTSGAAGVGLGSGAGSSFAAGGTRAGGSGRSARGQSPLVRAALSAGSPPGSNTTAGTSSRASSAVGASTPGQLNRIVGQLGSVGSNSLSVQSFQGGTQSVTVTSQTRFYQTVAATATALALGEQVTIRASGSVGKPVATTITIGPSALAGGAGRFGSGGGFGGVPLTTLTGTITTVAAKTLDVTGVQAPVTLTSSTRISRIVPVQLTQLHAGTFVTVSLGSVGGRQVAGTVVARAGSSGRGFSGPGG
jgi:hypothetical protein